jgi:single-strand DNA-binding protein
MFSLNRAQIVGNVTRDPESRFTPNGQAVCSFGVATNRRWRDKDGNNQEATEFHNIVAWGKVAELMGQLAHKGTKIYVEGRLQTRQWEGQDGAKRNRTEIVMEDFIILTPKGATGGGDFVPDSEPKEFPGDAKKAETKEKPKAAPKEEPAEDEINLDEIPF